MIGALLFKWMLRNATADVNRRDFKRIISHYADDAVLVYPGNMTVSGTWKGKQAIEEFFRKYEQQFTQECCVVQETFVKNLLGLGPSNTVAIKFEKTVTNKDGESFRASGMTLLRIKRGKVVENIEYFFDVDQLQRMWGEHNGAQSEMKTHTTPPPLCSA